MIAALHTERYRAMTHHYRYAAFFHGHSGAFESFHDATQRGLQALKTLSDTAVAAARRQHDALTRSGDNLWVSKKLLDDEVVQYCTDNVRLLFATMERLAQAQSAVEIVAAQSEFACTFTIQVTNQARE